MTLCGWLCGIGGRAVLVALRAACFYFLLILFNFFLFNVFSSEGHLYFFLGRVALMILSWLSRHLNVAPSLSQCLFLHALVESTTFRRLLLHRYLCTKDYIYHIYSLSRYKHSKTSTDKHHNYKGQLLRTQDAFSKPPLGPSCCSCSSRSSYREY